jgi:hypothetical protein
MKLGKYFLAWLLAMTTFVAQAQERFIGYSQTDSITVSGGAFGAEGTYPIGAVLTPQMLSGYAGCRVVGIRLAVSQNLGRARTFIYSIGNSALTVEVEQRQRIYEGWNTVYFNGDGYQIKGTEILFFGFDYTETAEMVAADEGALCGFGNDVDGSFYTYYDFGNGLSLYSLSGIGRLCVQLIVDVSSLPTKDLDLTAIDTGFKYKVAGENIDVMADFMNVGLDSIMGYQLGCLLDEEEPVYMDFSDTIASGRSGVNVFTFKLPQKMEIGLHKFSVFINKIGGQPLHDKSRNDTLSVSFAIYENSALRSRAYLEIYTDQTSAYVPYLDKAVQMLVDNSNQLAVVNVHRPGTPLSIGDSDYLHELYAYDWPTFTMNRAYFPGEAYVAYDMNDYLPVIGAEMTAGIIGDMVMQDFNSPSFATIDLQLGYNKATRQLTVKASGDMLPEAKAIYGDLALTLMLTEDGVKGNQMQYNEITQRTTNNSRYVHNQVLRHYLTAPIGDGIESVDDRYTANYETTLDEGWNAEKMTVVALLTKKVDAVTEENLTDVDVINCNSVALSEIIDLGVKSVGIGQRTVSGDCHLLDGRRVDSSSLKSGVYIQNGKKILRK